MLLPRRLLVAALLATLALGGCGGGGIAGEESKPNATDAAFAKAVAAHQRRTGDIAKIARRQARRRELRALAATTVARNDDQVRALTAAAEELRRRSVSPVGANVGEPPPVDPRALRGAGSSDLEVLEQLIRQHEFALRAARVERQHGGDRTLQSLAKEIEETSRRDLEKLKGWLRTWYGKEAQPGIPPGPPPGPGPSPPPGGPSPGPPV